MDEAVAALLFAHSGKRRRIGNACGVFVAEEFYIAAQWNSAHFPTGAMAIIEAEELRPETDRKDQDADTTSAGNHEVAEFVEEHHQRQDEEVADHPPPARARRKTPRSTGSLRAGDRPTATR